MTGRYVVIPGPNRRLRKRVLASDPKVAHLSPVARELYLMSVEWCGKNNTDRIPKWMVPQMEAVAMSRCRARGEIQ